MKPGNISNNDVIELAYCAKIEPNGDIFLVTFRDLDNVFTQGESYQEAIFRAQEVLDLMLLDRLEKDEVIPFPSLPQPGEVRISPSPEVTAPVLLNLLRGINHKSMADVARAMGVPYQSYQRIESGKNLTLKTLKKAALALGSTVEIRLRKAKAG